MPNPSARQHTTDWSLLASLAPAEREQLLASTRRRTYARNEVLVRGADPSDSLHLVETGRLGVRVDTAAGDTAMLSVIGPGSWFGELSLLGNDSRRTATVVALEPATTRSLSTTAFADLRRRHPAVDQLLLSLLSQRIDTLSGLLVESMYDGLDRRVHRRLADLVDTYGEPPGAEDITGHGNRPVTVPLTQEQLAELVGGTRSSVNEVLQRLARRGVVELGRGRIVVRRPHELTR